MSNNDNKVILQNVEEDLEEALEENVAENTTARFLATPRDRHLFPTEKRGHTTKDRRYRPNTKVTDQGKTFGKKGKPYKQLKQEIPDF